jgi:hypothetical protein
MEEGRRGVRKSIGEVRGGRREVAHKGGRGWREWVHKGEERGSDGGMESFLKNMECTDNKMDPWGGSSQV